MLLKVFSVLFSKVIPFHLSGDFLLLLSYPVDFFLSLDDVHRIIYKSKVYAGFVISVFEEFVSKYSVDSVRLWIVI